MKKLTTSVLIVVLSSSLGMVGAQTKPKKDTLKETAIGEVVITGAMGIKKKLDQQTSSAAVVNNAELTQANNQNAAAALTGKVAGLTISQSNSGVNGNLDIRIRTSKTLTGSTTPLIVIDGVKSSVSVYTQLPSDMIESQTILKGMQGAALYGSDGVNGAIIVTTKKGNSGSKRVKVTLNSGVEFENALFVPDRQKRYGQGWDGQRVHVENGAWGPAYDDPKYAGQMLPSGIPLYDVNGDGAITINGNNGTTPQQDISSSLFFKYAPLGKDNVKQFFQTGHLLNNSLTVSTGDSDAYASLTINNQQKEFIVRDDTNKRTSVLFKGGFKKDKWIVDGMASITNNSTSVTNGDIYPNLLHTPSEIDTRQFDGVLNNDRAYAWTMFMTNPYWDIKHNRGTSKTTTFNGTLNLTYKINEHISIINNGSGQYVVGDGLSWRDAYSGTAQRPTIAGLTAIGASYSQSNSINRFLYNDLMADFNYELTKDLQMNFLAGFNVQESYFKSTAAGGTGLNIPGKYAVWNVVNPTQPYNLNPNNSRTLARKYAFFGNLDLNYKDYLSLNATIRSEWSSKFINSENVANSKAGYVYPSVGVSFNAKNAFSGLKSSNDLSRFVVKGSWTRVGQDDPVGIFGIEDTAMLGGGFPYAGGPLSFIGNSQPTAFNVKPQFITSTEFNLGLGFLKDRILLDVNAFQTDTKDLITWQSTSSASGITRKLINIGKIQSKGIEIELGLVPIKTQDFKWDIRASYYTQRQKVLELPDGQDEVAIYSSGNVGIYAVKGETFPIIKGTGYLRDDQGRIIIDEKTGNPLATNSFIKLGQTDPKYILTFNTNLKYKNWSVYATMDYRAGHKIYSDTMYRLAWGGYLVDSAEYDRSQGGYVIPNSVYMNSAGQYVANTSIKSGGNAYEGLASYYGGTYSSIAENFVIDAKSFKVRELGINYTLNRDTARSFGIEGLQFGLYARNPFYSFSKENRGYTDPEASLSNGNNIRGISAQTQYPSTRVIGFNTIINF